MLRILCIFLALALGGCETLMHPFAPRQSIDTNADILQLEEKYGKASAIKEYYAAEPTLERRNEIITGRLALINLNYVQFVRQFAADKAQLDTALDMLQLGVDVATTIVGGAAVKSALGAVSAGITGTRTSVHKNFFFEQTAPALITAMNAQRKEALVSIIRGINSSLQGYSFAQGIADLEAYYFAGTFAGGLQAIQKDAGQKEAKADEKIEAILLRKITLASVTPEMFEIRANLRSSVDGLDPAKARRLITTIGSVFTEIKPFIESQYPAATRAVDADGSKAKTVLRRAVNDTALSAEDAAKWQAAIANL